MSQLLDVMNEVVASQKQRKRRKAHADPLLELELEQQEAYVTRYGKWGRESMAALNDRRWR